MAYLSRALSALRRRRTTTATEPWVRDQIDAIPPGGGGSATDLSYDAASRLLSSSTGLDVTLPLAGADAGLMSAADKTKLNGVATGATANASDASLRDRSTHTGTQDAATITGSKTSSFISDFAAAVAALITGKANVSHSHVASDVTDFAEAVDDRVASLVIAGPNVSVSYDDVANTLTISASGGGGGGIPVMSWVV